MRYLQVSVAVRAVYHLSLVCTDERIEVTNIPEMNVDHHFLDRLKVRLRVAKEIDAMQHRASKAAHDIKWMRATAEALDIELDSDYQSECVFYLFVCPAASLLIEMY